nr:VQ motif-containing protein 19-like [Coffea arabica]
MKKPFNKKMGQSPPELGTYFQVDKTTFRELVQKLTGATGNSTNKPPEIQSPSTSPKRHGHIDPPGVRRSPLKLRERRQQTAMRKMEIKLGLKAAGESVSQPDSPGCPPTPVHSPMTPLGRNSVVSTRVGTESPPSEEERAIAEKGFYLHPSPRKPEPPELLTLFPLTSPR